MDEFKPSEKDLTEFYRAYDRNHQFFLPLASGFQKESTEYAKIIFRQLFLLNGGALVLVPTWFSSISSVDQEITVWAARFFVAGLAFVLIATYSSHLNFGFIAKILRDEENDRVEKLKTALLGGGQEDQNSQETIEINWSIITTFWVSHVTGILSFLSLVFGAWKILETAQ